MTIHDLREEITHWKLSGQRILHLAIGILALSIYEFIARPFYRPSIYNNHIYDFHLADTIGNTLGTIATVYFFVAVLGRTRAQHLFLIKVVTLSVALYEIAHPLLGKPMDPWDLAATLITGVGCYGVYNLIHRGHRAAEKEK